MYDLFAGVKVVEVASYTFVPAAGTLLADWGASVIKIEEPAHPDPQRWNNVSPPEGFDPMFEIPNRGKRSLALNLKDPKGLEILYRLVEDADVFITNFRTELRERLKIDRSSIAERNPRVVYASGSGQGPEGPEGWRPGFDLAATWARTLASEMAVPGSPPPSQPGSIGDLVGGMAIACGIGASLFARERGKEPPEVDVSLYGVGMWMMAQSITAAPLGLRMPHGQVRTEMRNPLTNPFPTKDGRWVWLAIPKADHYWPDVRKRLGEPSSLSGERFETMAGRSEYAVELIAALDCAFRTKTLDEWRAELADAEWVWSPVLSPVEISNDPQAEANGYLPFVQSDQADRGVYLGVASPVRYGGEPLGDLTGAPRHGQHTDDVLLEYGVPEGEINELRMLGIVH
jgi:crotonobetainyl-CoA:carnitine CoA-transferase CaiB-like acyl-CoA transferase